LANQLSCALPSRFRGIMEVQGMEPGAAGYPGMLPPCNPSPAASFFVHDRNNTDYTYASVLPACTRMLKQNGCSVTTCNPLDPTLTTPYRVPAGVNLPQGAACVTFNGCPADYPVVFCTTFTQGNNDGQQWGIVPLWWDWMSSRLP
jgi:hypothetical protein